MLKLSTNLLSKMLKRLIKMLTTLTQVEEYSFSASIEGRSEKYKNENHIVQTVEDISFS